MASVRLVSWNVNSLRSRFDHIERLLTAENPDILCMQETKVEDGLFPADWFRERGYEHLHFAGQKSYHGVAIVSRLPLDPLDGNHFGGAAHARHVAARLPQDVVLHNFYVPAGGDIPDPEQNDKFAHKLTYLDDMTSWSAGLGQDARAILVGDLNIAPLESDVWSHKALVKVVSHTPIEVERMARLQAAGGWRDVMRQFIPESEKLYTWWSYRARDWAEADKGRRLDHVWVTPALDGTARAMRVIKDARGWEKPSDHAPVLVDFEL
ncbi:exodeoxyribonuclease III [Govanella unica]|uniref:Exodeoxyribonuclease III n=1 Tax=Govanella unica TaxID=2975056 RepID=A0A9X3TUG3_9PROT|nr:exodeoxyribonuclease III [Govania unica]MDA5192440.1 exodeoxyribonuclease III [Govania unica]